MPPRVPIQEPPRIERRSQSAPPTISSTTEARFRPVNPQGVSSGHTPTPTDRIRPISSPQSRSLSPHEIHPVPRSSSSPKMQQQQQVATTSRRSYAPAAEARAMTPSPTLSDAFGNNHHFGEYPSDVYKAKARKKQTPQQAITKAKDTYARRDAESTLNDRFAGKNPPKTNTKAFLSPRNKEKLLKDKQEAEATGSDTFSSQIRARMSEGNIKSKKQSTRIHMERKQPPLNPVPGSHPGWHLDSKQTRRIPSLPRSEPSSDSDYSSDEVRATNKSGLPNHNPRSYFQPPKKKK